MISRARVAALGLAVLLATSGAVFAKEQPADPGIVFAESDDAELNAAIKDAQSTLPSFWSRYERRTSNEGPFLLKVALPTRDNSLEHIWLLVTKRGEKITGTLANEPINIAGLSQGSTVTVTPRQVTDWTYVRQGVTYGQFTTRVFAKRMSPEDRAAALAGLSSTPIEDETR